MVTVPDLQTERLLLRGWRETDLDDHAGMCADPEVMRYIGDGRPLDRAQSWRMMAFFVGHWELRGYGQWVLELKDGGDFVGRAGLWRPAGWPGLEVGWALARAHWGQGYATEAGRAAIDFAWRVVGADELISVIEPENAASRRVAERLGLRLDRRQMLGDSEVVIYRLSRAG